MLIRKAVMKKIYVILVLVIKLVGSLSLLNHSIVRVLKGEEGLAYCWNNFRRDVGMAKTPRDRKWACLAGAKCFANLLGEKSFRQLREDYKFFLEDALQEVLQEVASDQAPEVKKRVLH